MIFKRHTTYLNWDAYTNHVNFLSTFNWQQSVRRGNIQ